MPFGVGFVSGRGVCRAPVGKAAKHRSRPDTGSKDGEEGAPAPPHVAPSGTSRGSLNLPCSCLFREYAEPGPAPEEDLDQRALTAPKDEQVASARVSSQHTANLRGKGVEAAT